MNFPWPRALPILIALGWIGLDQWLKAHVLALNAAGLLERYSYNPNLDVGTMPVIPGFLALAYTINYGAAWSLFSGATPVLVALRFAAGAAMLWYLWHNHQRLPKLQSFAIALIAGGAFGNAIDGLMRGHVIDMLLSHWLTAVYRLIPGTNGAPFPIFNLADTGVVSGVILLALSSLLTPETKRQPIR